MSLSVLNNFELCYRGTSFKVQGGSVIAAFFLAHNYVSEQFGNYVEYGMYIHIYFHIELYRTLYINLICLYIYIKYLFCVSQIVTVFYLNE